MKKTGWIVSKHKNKILVAKRSKKSNNAGQWGFFGGTVDKGESIKRGALRELLEEAGVIVRIKKKKKIVDNKVMVFYTAKKFTPKLNREHDDVQWVSKKKAKKLKLHKPVKEFLK